MLLKIGSTGEDVKRLQRFLGLKDDGSFGSLTETKVKEFQIKNNLTADGVVGDGTWGKMFPNEGSVLADITPGPFKLEKLKRHIPDAVIMQIPETANKFNIVNILRLSHFLAQCGHESGGFKATSENLNYSADGLLKIFPKYFPTRQLAESYARKPEAIASKVYGSRMGNGPESTQEGFKFRGRGYIQLTGKENYSAFDKFVPDDILTNPELVASKYPLMSAAWFFDKNGLWSICDKGATDDVVTAVTKRVNGGTIGLADRIKHFKEYYSLLS
jgi:putative chitinase